MPTSFDVVIVNAQCFPVLGTSFPHPADPPGASESHMQEEMIQPLLRNCLRRRRKIPNESEVGPSRDSPLPRVRARGIRNAPLPARRQWHSGGFLTKLCARKGDDVDLKLDPTRLSRLTLQSPDW